MTSLETLRCGLLSVNTIPSRGDSHGGLWRKNRREFVGLVLCLLLVIMPARAQCPGGWLQGDGVSGIDSPVNAIAVWDPDGPGPGQSLLLVGGGFSVAGNVMANGIAVYDPAHRSWSPLGS